MSLINEEVWSRLSVTSVPGQALWACRAVPEINDRLLAALDADGERHLLLLLSESESDFHDSQSRGMEVLTRELSIPGHQAGRYLDIVCHDASGYDAFDLIGGEIAERLAANKEGTIRCVSSVLAKWRRFWSQLSQQLMSRNEQLGLFAELWFLSTWLIPRVGVTNAVKSWRGPFGSRHDFEWLGHSVEVKATTSNRGAIHRIHGIDQLAPPEAGALMLFSLQLREEGGASNNLPALVAVCRDQLAEDDETWSRFETALVQAGYMDAQAEHYSQLRLRIAVESLYSVRDEFPRLSVEQFAAGMPEGVEKVDYEINLNGFERYRIAEKPTDQFPV